MWVTWMGCFSHAPIREPGVCPDREPNPRPFPLWDNAHPTEPRQSEQAFSFLLSPQSGASRGPGGSIVGNWYELPSPNLPTLSIPFLTLAVALGLKLKPWDPGPRLLHFSLYTPPSGAKEWLAKGGGQLENKQVVRGLSDSGPCGLPEGTGMVGEEEEKIGGREWGKGRGFVTCHLLWLSPGRAKDQYKAAGACACSTSHAAPARVCPAPSPPGPPPPWLRASRPLSSLCCCSSQC